MKISSRSILTSSLLAMLLSTQVQAEAKQDKKAVKAPAAEAQAPVDRVSQQDLTAIQNYQLQAQNIRLQMQVLNRQLADVAGAQQAYVESVFASNKRGPEWTINTQTGAWEKKEDLQTADAGKQKDDKSK